ncbi:MAG TPA: 23S rRNA (pseudouridine(1915)-N(3))-methyltransferase RlmH [Dissulfurispiraceae bacterium]|nr:23S rRNA (pseudouridine(1915)-N(3))-methyltransferase RlmH [Dissulfurispiraceae bacterium]
MKIKIVWVGKTKEQFLAEGIEKYLRFLAPMAQVCIAEIKEEKGKAREAALKGEEAKILKQTSDYYLLDERGRGFSSVGFAEFLLERDAVDFVIGGPYGVSEKVRERAKGLIALSKMTLTHEMARLLLMEQLFRGHTILMGKEYHH